MIVYSPVKAQRAGPRRQPAAEPTPPLSITYLLVNANHPQHHERLREPEAVGVSEEERLRATEEPMAAIIKAAREDQWAPSPAVPCIESSP